MKQIMPENEVVILSMVKFHAKVGLRILQRVCSKLVSNPDDQETD